MTSLRANGRSRVVLLGTDHYALITAFLRQFSGRRSAIDCCGSFQPGSRLPKNTATRPPASFSISAPNAYSSWRSTLSIIPNLVAGRQAVGKFCAGLALPGFVCRR